MNSHLQKVLEHKHGRHFPNLAQAIAYDRNTEERGLCKRERELADTLKPKDETQD